MVFVSTEHLTHERLHFEMVKSKIQRVFIRKNGEEKFSESPREKPENRHLLDDY